jgi:hypothetical protein
MNLVDCPAHCDRYGKEQKMKAIRTLLLVGLVLLTMAASVYAGGDKNRGDEGQGSVNQVQVQDPPPFQP